MITTTQLHRLLHGLTGRVNELSGRVELGEVQAQSMHEELHRLEALLASKADRRMTAMDRFGRQPVPKLTVDEWLADCDVAFWMEELFHGDAELLATLKPARALTQVLQKFVEHWWIQQLAEAEEVPPGSSSGSGNSHEGGAAVAPPIRGMMVGKGRVLYWFLATNWGAVTGVPPVSSSSPAAAATAAADGNASILLHGATDATAVAASVAAARHHGGGGGSTLHRAAAAVTLEQQQQQQRIASGAQTWRSSTTAILDADAMSEITEASTAYRGGGATPHTPAGVVVPSTPAAVRTVLTARSSSMYSQQQHLVPLEGIWHRMDARKHWANIVTVLFQRYAEYMDLVIERASADKAMQLALLTGRAKCCSAAELARMRVAFYDALAKVPGAIL